MVCPLVVQRLFDDRPLVGGHQTKNQSLKTKIPPQSTHSANIIWCVAGLSPTQNGLDFPAPGATALPTNRPSDYGMVIWLLYLVNSTRQKLTAKLSVMMWTCLQGPNSRHPTFGVVVVVKVIVGQRSLYTTRSSSGPSTSSINIESV